MPLLIPEHTQRRPGGYAKIVGPNGIQEADTQTCVHCNTVFHMVKGSGTRRGYCMRCKAITCGSKRCDTCIPFEALLEHWEGKTTPYTGAILDQFGRAIQS